MNRTEHVLRELVNDGECAAGMAWCPGGDLCDHTAAAKHRKHVEDADVLDEIFEDAAYEAAVDDAIMDAIDGSR